MSELPENIPLYILYSNESTSLFITHYTNNDFATAVNSVALFGEFKTPSLPPSVHIPPIIPYNSLLPSRDEVFKEIKDVGEDVAISSLHLFQGDMDLPPLSFYASLEEKWDEEEEPEESETVLKVVPPAYHQYLDVFSKVKAEKRPPPGACDHHIELEGLLPPIKVSSVQDPLQQEDLSFLLRKRMVAPVCVLTTANSVLSLGRTVYLDDIMVLSSSEEEHVKHVASVLQRLRDTNLFSKASKCLFHAANVEYLGYVISSDGLKMDSSKVHQILNWPQPKNIKALQSFPGFANFYFCFIKNYSKEICALTSFFKKYSPFIFNEEAFSQFQILKEAFTTAPILFHFNPSLPTILESDASDYALGAVMSQLNDSGNHPIAFDSCKLLPAESNYEVHDKALLGIVWAVKHWRAFRLSLSDSFEVFTYHSSLQYFMSSKVLTCHQARWAEVFSELYFSITYCTGRMATLPDALSHQ
ncbi:hypothetical protein O181_012592 [Austropuccinia psidii MF-1]|uniref:Reverse transcriptase/retrotransposon-derived protein RNase H-like domain-containing protein n=1 Tax=Austropuccinia psidii MF-1 TaxID=1389203 RepID=A0A9Q3BY02_9BASI|nr:hypothetical protein [Austropuccinia psidii MF-1]